MIFKILTILISVSMFIDEVVAPPTEEAVTVEKEPYEVAKELAKLLDQHPPVAKNVKTSEGNGESAKAGNEHRIKVCDLEEKTLIELCKAIFDNIGEKIDPNGGNEPTGHTCVEREINIPLCFGRIDALAFGTQQYDLMRMAECPKPISGTQYMVAEALSDASVLLLRELQEKTDAVYTGRSGVKKVFPLAIVKVSDAKYESLLGMTLAKKILEGNNFADMSISSETPEGGNDETGEENEEMINLINSELRRLEIESANIERQKKQLKNALPVHVNNEE